MSQETLDDVDEASEEDLFDDDERRDEEFADSNEKLNISRQDRAAYRQHKRGEILSQIQVLYLDTH